MSVCLGIVSSLFLAPLRTATQALLERLYGGKSFLYYQELRKFSADLTSIVSLEDLAKLTVDYVMSTFKLDWAFVLINDYNARHFRIIAAKGLDFAGEGEQARKSMSLFREQINLSSHTKCARFSRARLLPSEHFNQTYQGRRA
jgi:hypothetical protein